MPRQPRSVAQGETEERGERTKVARGPLDAVAGASEYLRDFGDRSDIEAGWQAGSRASSRNKVPGTVIVVTRVGRCSGKGDVIASRPLPPRCLPQRPPPAVSEGFAIYRAKLKMAIASKFNVIFDHIR